MRVDTVLRKITATTQGEAARENGMLGGRPPAYGCLCNRIMPGDPVTDPLGWRILFEDASSCTTRRSTLGSGICWYGWASAVGRETVHDRV